MRPLTSVGLLFWVTVIACTAAFASDRQPQQILYRHWRLLLLLVSLVVIWRVPFHGHSFFHGLEYEDSYVYTAAGRQFAISGASTFTDPEFPYSITSCAVGSLQHCMSWQTFPEHLIGYPYLISLCSKFVGYSPSIGSLINLAGSVMASVLIFLIAVLLTNDIVAATGSMLVFAWTPVFAVYGLETSAEPISNVFLLLGMYFFVRLSGIGRVAPIVLACTWCGFTCSLLYALTIKREDILAVAMLVTFAFYGFARRMDRDEIAIGQLALLLLTAVLSVLIEFRLHLVGTAQGEAALVHQFPFTLRALLEFLLRFVESFCVIRWYGGTTVLVAVGVIAAFTRWRSALVVVACLAAFIVLYGLHVRSYYEMRSSSTTLQGALRFSMNLIGFWSITAGLGLCFLYQRIARNFRHDITILLQSTLVLFGISSLIAVLSFRATLRLREYETEDEQISRLEPALSASAIASSANRPVWILTMEPLIFQMYENPGLNVVDLESASDDTLSHLSELRPKSLWVLEREAARTTDDDADRYDGALPCALFQQHQSLGMRDGFEIDLITRPHTCPSDRESP